MDKWMDLLGFWCGENVNCLDRRRRWWRWRRMRVRVYRWVTQGQDWGRSGELRRHRRVADADRPPEKPSEPIHLRRLPETQQARRAISPQPDTLEPQLIRHSLALINLTISPLNSSLNSSLNRLTSSMIRPTTTDFSPPLVDLLKRRKWK
ncbi:hypothetical protein Droror1_Dr00007236 [Drosera rotundifolia]